MEHTDLAPRPAYRGVVAVWATALVAGVVIAVFVGVDQQAKWFAIALAGSLVLAFAIQIARASSVGFILRVALSVLGALLVLGLVAGVVGIAALVPTA